LIIASLSCPSSPYSSKLQLRFEEVLLKHTKRLLFVASSCFLTHQKTKKLCRCIVFCATHNTSLRLLRRRRSPPTEAYCISDIASLPPIVLLYTTNNSIVWSSIDHHNNSSSNRYYLSIASTTTANNKARKRQS